MLSIARTFIGRPYVGGTLEVNAPEEWLVVDTLHVDCTTFVDQVLAMAMANSPAPQERKATEVEDCVAFRNCLQQIRYHDGKINGYASRRHYFTDLAEGLEEMGVLEPVTSNKMAERTISLTFMSTHPDSYIQLKDNPTQQALIREAEKRFANITQRYFPKEDAAVFHRATSPIHDGDIIALVTTVKGLDVSHLGFAVWVDDELHLLNASSRKGAVVLDDQPLADYLKTRTSCPGIQAFRFDASRTHLKHHP